MNSQNYQIEKILTVQEVAGILRIHRATVSRYAMSGDLKSHLIECSKDCLRKKTSGRSLTNRWIENTFLERRTKWQPL